MGSSVVSSLPETSLSEEWHSCGVTWHYYNSFRSICPSSSWEANQKTRRPHWWPRGRLCWHGRARGLHWWTFGGRNGTKGGQGPREGRDGFIIYCYYCKESSYMKYQYPLMKEKSVRGAHISVTLSDDGSYEVNLKSFKCYSSNRTHKLSIPLSLPL